MAGNHNSGRRPKPTALKVLQGNPGKRPLNDAEPKPPVGQVRKPSGLSSGASVVWDTIAPDCIGMGTLTRVDISAFRALCELQATFDAEVAKKDTQPTEFSPKLERETALALARYYERFGLDPSSRARIRLPKPEQPTSKWEGMLA